MTVMTNKEDSKYSDDSYDKQREYDSKYSDDSYDKTKRI